MSLTGQQVLFLWLLKGASIQAWTRWLVALVMVAGALQDEIGVDINWRPYQLNPDYPPEGVDHQVELAKKLGGKDKMDQAHAHLKSLGAEVGIAFDFEAIKVGPNTLDAHRLIAWVQTDAEHDAEPLVEALFRAYFVEGRFIDRRRIARHKIPVDPPWPNRRAADQHQMALAAGAEGVGLAFGQHEHAAQRQLLIV